MERKRGLKERIETAETVSEVEALLREGQRYQNATNGLRKRWQKLARARIAIIEKES